MTSKATFLDITSATEEYAELNGAIFSENLGWHIFGVVPIALEDFIIKTPRSAGPVWAMRCPICGSQMEIINSKHGNLFWRCMTSRCHGKLSIDTPDESIKKQKQINSKIYKQSVIKKEIIELSNLATRVLKTHDNVERWFKIPKIKLEGKSPIMMLTNINDIKKVRTLLLELYD